MSRRSTAAATMDSPLPKDLSKKVYKHQFDSDIFNYCVFMLQVVNIQKLVVRPSTAAALTACLWPSDPTSRDARCQTALKNYTAAARTMSQLQLETTLLVVRMTCLVTKLSKKLFYAVSPSH